MSAVFRVPLITHNPALEDGYETDIVPDLPSVYRDFDAVRKKAEIKSFKAKFVKRKYAFGEPDVPMGEPWKEGVLARLGRRGQHPGEFWKELLARVRTCADLQPPLVGAVEQLIDFVTEPAS